ncbi:MAG: OmpA family protein [Nannocystaceae bacterium]
MLRSHLALTTLAAVVASASDPVTYAYSPQTDASGKVSFTLQFHQGSSNVEVVINGDDGSTVKRSLGTVKAGKEVNVTWTQRKSAVRYEMELTAETLNGNFTFEVVKAAPKGGIGKLKFISSREDIVDRRKASYKAPFPLTSYEYKVIDDDGDTIASDTVTDRVGANETFTITWTSPAAVFMIEVKGEDQYGRFVEDRRVPYSVDIPHTEVNFDSGKANIKPGEIPKLDEAVAVAFHELDALDRVNEAVNANLTTQLYIVGYTDTVGNAAKNQKLSNGRAKSIAKYFYDQGFWAEIYYAGMGERGLRVQTDDNVDEVRNRRALYLIAFQKPGAGGQIPGRWTLLSGARSRPAGFELPALPEEYADYRNKNKGGGSGSAGSDEGGVDGADDDGASDLDDGDAGASYDDGGDDDAGGGGGGNGAPPPVEGEPTATSKGCRVGEGGPSPLALGWLVLLGAGALGRRRRRR